MLKVDTIPTGGDVWIDGARSLGDAPIEVDISSRFGVPIGSHNLFDLIVEGRSGGDRSWQGGVEALFGKPHYTSLYNTYDFKLGLWRGNVLLQAGQTKDGKMTHYSTCEDDQMKPRIIRSQEQVRIEIVMPLVEYHPASREEPSP